MIIGSGLLVLAAAALLVAGVTRQLDDALIYSSIVVCALAALALVAGVRQLPAVRLPDADFDVRRGGPGIAAWPWRSVGRAGVPRQSRIDGADGGLTEVDRAHLDLADLAVPADEPPAQEATEEDAAAVARLRAEVVVVDDRPRYHVPDCLHLLGRQGQRLSARQATRLGFTPCALCEPVTALLASR